MELQGSYVNKTPAVTLPVEYFEGPAIWNGTYQGNAVQGLGIFESTLALYRDWELAKVLYDSIVHLPESSFSQTMKRSAVARAVEGVNEYVSSSPLGDNRIEAKAYIESHVMPALNTMESGKDKIYMLEIAQDLQSSLDLILEF